MFAAAPPEALLAQPEWLEAIGANAARLADVERYRALLTLANETVNLVGAATLSDFWNRHFIDSAQLVRWAPEAMVWADLGSGAGLPGVVVAILLKHRPGARVHLVESTAKRFAFLKRLVEALELPADVHHARAETLSLEVEIVTARACAPLARLLEFAEPYLARGARGLFLKGAEVDAEITEARRRWRFVATSNPSLSDPRGRVLAISELARAGHR